MSYALTSQTYHAPLSVSNYNNPTYGLIYPTAEAYPKPGMLEV